MNQSRWSAESNSACVEVSACGSTWLSVCLAALQQNGLKYFHYLSVVLIKCGRVHNGNKSIQLHVTHNTLMEWISESQSQGRLMSNCICCEVHTDLNKMSMSFFSFGWPCSQALTVHCQCQGPGDFFTVAEVTVQEGAGVFASTVTGHLGHGQKTILDDGTVDVLSLWWICHRGTRSKQVVLNLPLSKALNNILL